jgi:hypothetical protein
MANRLHPKVSVTHARRLAIPHKLLTTRTFDISDIRAVLQSRRPTSL